MKELVAIGLVLVACVFIVAGLLFADNGYPRFAIFLGFAAGGLAVHGIRDLDEVGGDRDR